ncbi:hypothetical protein [Chryseobacterium sp. WLY505]|uniref:hypothetical protein n=1 Tax=Chryseobacterium sp. WLY505 TaxID=3068892 RepID=UPI002796B168|nr:hypothetical protein [Chryseobacterium sp. WLY505]MDQ1859260.1 hypothetical protein [Chryseobacterium sp. WLY505]
MKFLERKERLKILISISDQLWDDYKSGTLKADEYLKKADEIREELNTVTDVTFFDMQELSKSLGYILIKSRNIFGTKNQYNCQRLIFN